jgi:hypothetical protein
MLRLNYESNIYLPNFLLGSLKLLPDKTPKDTKPTMNVTLILYCFSHITLKYVFRLKFTTWQSSPASPLCQLRARHLPQCHGPACHSTAMPWTNNSMPSTSSSLHHRIEPSATDCCFVLYLEMFGDHTIYVSH